MIMATVITCPQRWSSYQRLRTNFESLHLPFPLQTFQTAEWLFNPVVNNSLNARAALAYCQKHLPDRSDSWVLYLEDDVVLKPELKAVLPALVEMGVSEMVDCWYLCNRRNEVQEQFRRDGMVVNQLAFSPEGGHGLLLPKRHLQRILASHWFELSDRAIFAAINHSGLKIWQVVHPVLLEHIGEYSTFDPGTRRKLEVNYAIGLCS